MCKLIDLPDEATLAETLGISLDTSELDKGTGAAQANAVTDAQAELFLRRAHQRLGHASMKLIRQLHRSGAIFGPDVSDSQFECLQFHCPTCQVSLQKRKAYAQRREES